LYMSLDKAIFYGKEKRKPYRGSKRFDRSCRNHGGCGYCLNNRMYQKNKVDEKAELEMKEFKNEMFLS
jgi:hypothetical protein